MLAQVEKLMTGNQLTIDANPVGTVRELLARGPSKPAGRATQRTVEDFLAAKPDQADAVETPVGTHVESHDKTRATKEQKPNRTRPIFRQS